MLRQGKKPCSVDSCNSDAKKMGFCTKHYQRNRKHSDPNRCDLIWGDVARFNALVMPEPNTGCWLWTGNIMHRGYAIMWANGKTTRVSRWSFRKFKGDIPDGMHVDHICEVKDCVNPDHLQLLTPAENNEKRDLMKKLIAVANG